MYIDYVTIGDNKVLHQMRAVEEGPTDLDNAVERLESTGFERMSETSDIEWTDGTTDAYIHFGSLCKNAETIKRDYADAPSHELVFMD
nr:MAG: hypothetical protein [Bacteriophage sp.]